MGKISYEKLSQLQKLILVALCEPRYAVMKRRAFNRLVKRLYYGKDSRVATASLSRAYQRLEDRQYIARSGGCWKLNDSNPCDNGVMLAFLAWGNNREFYALLGLKGPSLEALGIKPANAGSNPERRLEKFKGSLLLFSNLTDVAVVHAAILMPSISALLTRTTTLQLVRPRPSLRVRLTGQLQH